MVLIVCPLQSIQSFSPNTGELMWVCGKVCPR
uniref:Uncharacterized protein n=1 Tax=Anguilla anguilla TaxID=7936 RepID=A0A0E9XIW8_ANGAN